MNASFEYESVLMEAAILKELRAEWNNVNSSLFGGCLKAPTFILVDNRGIAGRWNGLFRQVEISRHGLDTLSWAELIEVVKHETAHQYVDEILGIRDETDHGPTFRSVCRDRGIDHRAAFEARERRGLDPNSRGGRVVGKIQRLLALAGSDNEHEARSAMSTAKRLMVKHNVSEAGLREDTDGYGYRHLGTPTGRVQESQRWLANILTAHFFVEAIWIPVFIPETGKRGHVLELCGGTANLEIAAYVFDYLNLTAEHLWQDHKRASGLQGNKDRQRFIAGVMLGFKEKLDAQEKQNEREGLVWLGDPMLTTYLRRRYPRVRTVTRRGGRACAAHAHGRNAGKNIVLHKGVGTGNSGAPRLLKARG